MTYSKYDSGKSWEYKSRDDSRRDRSRSGSRDNRRAHSSPIKKNCYSLSDTTANRDDREVQNYMEENEIAVKGEEFLRPVQTFQELNVPPYVLAPIVRNKFERPTPIQAQSWPLALSGYDMVGVAQTGSGKTYSFVLPAVVHIKNQEKKRGYDPQALILSPTRELCQQISQVAAEFAKDSKLKIVTVYGGAPKSDQKRALYGGVDILVATPGRLIDFMEMRVVSVKDVSFLVLDEADRMLDMGFAPQMKDIIRKTRKDRQTLMFSATWPKEVHKLADSYLYDYIKVNIGAQDLHANHKINQVIHMIDEREKQNRLSKLLDDIMRENENKTIVFVETKRGAEGLARMLYSENFPVVAMHGDKTQAERERALKDFKSGRKPILIATDVASRGIDIRDIRYVINFDYPNNSEDYVHRIGRTARSDATGDAHTFFTKSNAPKARDLVKVLEEAGQNVPRELLDMSRQAYGKPRFGGYHGRPKTSYDHSRPSHSHRKF
ncbi:putative ATP-dependent RNA helicase DDX5 [Convolutriloba macropyga]|uniref:putative ATP-dependent RNA helicase DDX5 n=1 Tax=Convolutriloba macropyga TaxID=536237 RepID=UPI003F525CC4